MKKKFIIIMGCLAVVCAVMSAVVAVGNSSVKMSNKNLTVVTAPDQKEAMENDALRKKNMLHLKLMVQMWR